MARHPDDDDYDDRPTRREYTHKTKGSFLSAFGMGSGAVLGILFVLVGLPILVCGGCLMIGVMATKKDSAKQNQKSDSPTTSATTSPPVSDDQTGEIGKEIRFGSLGMTVESIQLTSFSATSSLGRVFQSSKSDPDIVVRINLKNHDANKMVKATAQSGKAKMTDEHGNDYSEMHLMNEAGLPLRTDGSISAGHYIEFQSDEKVVDALVFKKPVPGANTITITLDAAQYGGKGKIRYVVNRDEFSPSAKSK